MFDIIKNFEKHIIQHDVTSLVTRMLIYLHKRYSSIMCMPAACKTK